MQTFLQKLALEIVKSPDFTQLTIVLPNKRASVFLKKELASLLDKPVISPKIISIEDFFEDLSPYQRVDWLPLLFYFYQTYKNIYKEKAQSFDEFMKWAPSVLQDFNDIDTYRIDAKEVFTYINEVKKIENWQLRPDSPKLITDYLKFYASLFDLYKDLVHRLSKQHLAYQGMIYAHVAEHIETISNDFKKDSLIFAGFNALNQAEEKVFKYLQLETKAKIFWDADAYYLKPKFEAGFFLRRYQKEFQNFNWIFDNFSQSKDIDIIGVSGQTAQAQLIGNITEKLIANSPNDIDNCLLKTAIVLNEDNMLLPIINALPTSIPALNITLGFPVGQLPVTQLFEQTLKLYYEFEQYQAFSVDTLSGWVHQNYLEQLFSEEEWHQNELFLDKIVRFKTKMISPKILLPLLDEKQTLLVSILKSDYKIDSLFEVFFKMLSLLENLKINEIDQLALVKLSALFSSLQEFIQETGEIKTIRTLQVLFKKLLYKERLAFEGDPLEGLQIMGILETRLLDFEHIIITSVNEGIIPNGKNERSIIPFELKKHFGLPGHYEQNAIVAYHFYRLIQRASKITLIYNTDDSGIGTSEQSRFVTQLENELDKNVHSIHKNVLKLQADLLPTIPEIIEKNEAVIKRLEEINVNGFSPSAMSMYIKNPINYYKKYILSLIEFEDIDEGIPAYTFGNIVHDVMDLLYRKRKRVLRLSDFDEMLKEYEDLAMQKFVYYTFGDDLSSIPPIIGKNLIAFEIIKKNIKDLILIDKNHVKNDNILEIIDVEQKLTASLSLSGRKVKIRGTIDRVDRLNGTLRILDYKTGTVVNADVTIGSRKEGAQLEKLLENKKPKLFQLLTYAWLYTKAKKIPIKDISFELGILSTRNYKSGMLKAVIGNQKEIDFELLQVFETQLKSLLSELFDVKTPFVEKEV